MPEMPGRPVMRYHGGKWRLAPWIIAHFPPHRIYVEPFGGAGSVLLRKPRSHAEVYNDLDNDVVNVFRILRDPTHAARLRQLCELTPWSRLEFAASYEPTDDPIEGARRTIYRSFAAYSTTYRSAHRCAFRAKGWRQNVTGVSDWASWPRQVTAYVERLRGVVIECRPALEVMHQYDSPETLFYLDPPYPISTRTSIRNRSESDADRAYSDNLTDEDHRKLAAILHEVRGMVVISSYPSALYANLFRGWHQVHRRAFANGARARTEVLWYNPAAMYARNFIAERAHA